MLRPTPTNVPKWNAKHPYLAATSECAPTSAARPRGPDRARALRSPAPTVLSLRGRRVRVKKPVPCRPVDPERRVPEPLQLRPPYHVRYVRRVLHVMHLC